MIVKVRVEEQRWSDMLGSFGHKGLGLGQQPTADTDAQIFEFDDN